MSQRLNKRKSDNYHARQGRRKMADAPKSDRRTVTVTIGIGTTQHTVDIHDDVLYEHSKFFKAAMRKPWQEAQTRCINLPEDSPGTFIIFYNFILDGQIFSSKEDDRYEVSKDREVERLADAWKLGDKWMSASFEDAVLDALVEKVNTEGFYPTGMQHTLYPISSPNAPARQLLVDIAVKLWQVEEIKEAFNNEKSETSCSTFLLPSVQATKREDTTTEN